MEKYLTTLWREYRQTERRYYQTADKRIKAHLNSLKNKINYIELKLYSAN